MKRTFLSITLACMALALAAYQGPTGWAAGEVKNTVLRIEVSIEHEQDVKISVPLSILDSLFEALPTELQDVCEELDLGPNEIQNEFMAMGDEDLVRITGNENVRVWFDSIDDEESKALNFISIHVENADGEGQTVNVNVPKGLVKLSSRIIKKLGIADELIDLPPEIRKKISMLRNEDQ